LFLKEGKFDFILQNDKDFSMSIDTKTKLSGIKIRVKLQDVIRERKRDYGTLKSFKSHKMKKFTFKREGKFLIYYNIRLLDRFQKYKVQKLDRMDNLVLQDIK